ncbi:hypothetical protein H5410_029319 [Solanum commersonii]|uniref:Uncharacterized protein n=1 Tax=Solanum commersonii TaxID=4109 RepID=A0A9J5Z4C8_SOLCO|nr:hypothetical protein H5410_029319 [Solanum commersonii]
MGSKCTEKCVFFHLASHYKGDFDNEKSEKAEGCLHHGRVYASGLNDYGQLGVSDDRAYITVCYFDLS